MNRRENCFKENDYGRSEVTELAQSRIFPQGDKENSFGRASDLKYGKGESCVSLSFKGKEKDDNLSFKAQNL